MARKIISWKTKGMNRDLSVSAFSPEFAFENMNLRLQTNEGNTLLSWVNEKGTYQLKNTDNNNIALIGVPIGTAVLNRQLVVFTHSSGSKPDYIYLLRYSDTTKMHMLVQVLYNGNLNFSVDYPLETLVSYEADYIQKVYWTDGLNQPRMINIAAPVEKRNKWIDTSFNFIPDFSGGKITVSKNSSGGGLFAPGVIQYAFTYVNKYGQQTNIVDVSPLYYLSFNDRGASPEEKLTNSFTITISEGDMHFDYIRLYSIQRTSINATPIVKLLEDIKIEESSEHSSYEWDYEYNVPIQLTYEKGSYPNLTLPLDLQSTSQQILAVRTVNERDSFTVDIVPKDNAYIFDNDTLFNFIAIADGEDRRQIMTLKELITEMVNNQFYSGSKNDCHMSDYYFYMEFAPEFRQEMMIRAENTGNFQTTMEWQFEANGANQNIDFDNDKLLYSFATQNWYVVTSLDNISISTKKAIRKEIIDIVGGSVYVDNGNTGAIIDPMELLYVGGHEISALTMADKDSTLFLGNCTQKNMMVTNIQKYFDLLRKNPSTSTTNRAAFYRDGAIKKIKEDPIDGVYYYNHTHNKNNREITTFKGGDTYRLGFQLQKKTGEWVEPIFMDDIKNLYYPETEAREDGNLISLSYAKAAIDISNISGSNYDIYKSIRPVIVFPTVQDREVLCQGVLNPTVFNSIDRIEKYPYAQASWYFRPYTGLAGNNGTPIADITSNIVIERATDNDDTSIEPSYFSGKCTQVYPAVFTILGDSIDIPLGIIKRGNAHIQQSSYEEDPHGNIVEDYWYPIVEKDFIGGAIIGERFVGISTEYTILLLSNTAWTFEWWTDKHVDPDGYTRSSTFTYIDTGTFIGAGVRPFSLYNKMKAVDGYLLYYESPEPTEESLNSYHFKCNIKIGDLSPSLVLTDGSWLGPAEGIQGHIDVTFRNIVNDADSVTNTLNGSSVRFRHYDHLFNRDDIGDSPNSVNQMRGIEIQNAMGLYHTPFVNYDSKKNTTNTEFFIDQSIVTLNSPDIDFDTQVQVYGNKDLNLRVIGAIPITACISAHSITSTSAMLELGHNVSNESSFKYGKGELRKNVWHNNSFNKEAYNSKRLVAEQLWNDAEVANDAKKDDKIKTYYKSVDFLVHPWHRTGSLNNDWRNEGEASSWLGTKKESNALFSMYTQYLQPSGESANSNIKNFPKVGLQMHLTENDYIINYRLSKQRKTSSDINYYPNIDKVLYVSTPYLIYPSGSEATQVSSPVQMKYKSTSHAVISLMPSGGTNIPILPYGDRGNIQVGQYTNDQINHGKTFWGDEQMFFSQEGIPESALPAIGYDFLWIGELYKAVDNPFGGTTDAAVRACTWQIAGEAVPLNQGKATIYWTEGDTYFQRYDCLKTYPFTNEDPNQLVEILSFMCETHVNIDGRYDKNRGQMDNTSMSPKNFNILNEVYTQPDNYFTSKKLDLEDVDKLSYPNQVTFTKTKTSGADVDLWTNMTLASSVEFDGDKGEVKSLQRFNNQLLCFQDTGISQILYNENVQISTEDGVPIELANSGKVQGKRYLSSTVGCSNKWSICNTPTGIYFMDSHGKNIFAFNGELQNISQAGGFNAWCKKNIPSTEDIWTPEFSDDTSIYKSPFVAHYDRTNQDILWINKDTALAWNEKLQIFTSFYDYGDTPWLCNLEDTGVWIAKNGTVWKHRAGEYCKFFGISKPFWTTLVGNPEPTLDKTFTNLEFRACVEGEGTGLDGGNAGIDVFDKTFDYTFHPDGGGEIPSSKYIPHMPFDNLEVWNEYQHGIVNLEIRNGHSLSLHHTGLGSALNRKFRIWRCDIPCNNYPMNKNVYGQFIPENDPEKGIYRKAMRARDRMRNPWIYLKLQKNAEESTHKTEVHDLEMTYYS